MKQGNWSQLLDVYKSHNDVHVRQKICKMAPPGGGVGGGVGAGYAAVEVSQFSLLPVVGHVRLTSWQLVVAHDEYLQYVKFLS
jgi:hypothetical protein